MVKGALAAAWAVTLSRASSPGLGARTSRRAFDGDLAALESDMVAVSPVAPELLRHCARHVVAQVQVARLGVLLSSIDLGAAERRVLECLEVRVLASSSACTWVRSCWSCSLGRAAAAVGLDHGHLNARSLDPPVARRLRRRRTRKAALALVRW